MSVHKIRELAAILHANHSPELRAFAAEQLQEMGLTMADIFQELEMNHKHVEAFREEGPCGLSAPMHSHRFLELICCRSSIGAECVLESQRYPLRQGDIMLVPPGVSHAVVMPENRDLQKKQYVIWLSVDYLSRIGEMHPYIANYTVKSGTVLHTAGTAWEYLELYFRSIVEEWEQRNPGWEVAMEAMAALLLVHLGRAVTMAPVRKTPPEKQDLLNHVLTFVEANLSERITLENTADRFFISTTTLSSLFSRRMGISFYQYVLQRRLREARDMIYRGMPIENIASRVGFSDYSAFYRAFRREYGMSPRQYRKAYYAEKNQPPVQKTEE